MPDVPIPTDPAELYRAYLADRSNPALAKAAHAKLKRTGVYTVYERDDDPESPGWHLGVTQYSYRVVNAPDAPPIFVKTHVPRADEIIVVPVAKRIKSTSVMQPSDGPAVPVTVAEE